MVVSACRTAVAEGCQDRASALSHLEDSRQGHRTALSPGHPQPRNSGPEEQLHSRQGICEQVCPCWTCQYGARTSCPTEGAPLCGPGSHQVPSTTFRRGFGRNGLSFYTPWPARGAPTGPDLCTPPFQIASQELWPATSHWPG